MNSLELRDVLVNKFRREWYADYLLSLRDKHKQSFSLVDCCKGNHKYLYADSVVLIKNPVKPRPYWSIGRIVELLPGEDNLIHVAKVLKPDNSTVTISVSNLYPLELDSGNESSAPQGEYCNNSNMNHVVDSSTDNKIIAANDPILSVSRPSRKAAVKLKKK